jgi:hypothetical protein
MELQMHRRLAREQALAVARRRSACAFAFVMVSACAHPVSPAAASEPVKPVAPSGPVAPVASSDPVSPVAPTDPGAGAAADRDHDAATRPDASNNKRRAPTAAASMKCEVFDPRNHACQGVCGNQGILLDGDECQHCPTPPDPNMVACQATMPCPDPPDRRVLACWPHRRVDDGSTFGRVIKVEATADGLMLAIGVGHASGIDKGFTATVLVGDTNTAMVGGDVELTRVDNHVTYGKVRLTLEQLGRNNRVRLIRK